MSLDQVVVHAQNARALASGDTTTASRIVELTGHAISSWRHLAGLDETKVSAISPAADDDLREIDIDGLTTYSKLLADKVCS